MRKMEVWAERSMIRNSIDLWVVDKTGDRVAYGLPLTMQTMTPEQEDCVVDSTMSLPVPTAQILMDELWRCGIRPTEGTGSAGSLAATERHLEDMRAIAFGSLGSKVAKP